MGKNNKAAQQLKKENKTPQSPGKAPKTPKVENTATKQNSAPTEEQVITQVATKPETLLERPSGGSALSADGKVKLLDLARRTFVEETRPYLTFPQETQTTVNRIVAIGILCTIADHVVDGDDSFAHVMQQQGYPALVKAAEDLGFKIPDIKALPANTEGKISLSAKQVEIPEETKEKIKKEKEISEGEKPELDPEKITSEEDLKKALEYIFIKGNEKSLPKLLTNAVDFMKKFRLHEASLAENATEARARFENYNTGDWLDDIFSYFQPPVFFNGIGRGMASVTEMEKSPVHAFIILRDAIRDKESGMPVLEDQEIAHCVKCIIKWFCNTNIKSNEKAVSELDEKKNKDVIVKCKEAIVKYNKILEYITNPSSIEADTLTDNIGSYFDSDGSQLTKECQDANRLYNKVCKSYYGKQISDIDYTNIATNIQQYVGCIINLFRDAGSQLVNYKYANITELEERSEEEKETLRKEAKKAWVERKQKEKGDSEKNV